MSQLITKLDSIPEDVTKANAPDGFHCVVLNYKTDSKTQIKRPSAAYFVPKLSNQDTDSVEGKAVNKWIDSLQRAALSEYNAGEYDFHSIIVDLDALFHTF